MTSGDDMRDASVKDAVDQFRKNKNGQVVLVLQGGGALGAYQVGVYQALHEAGVEPDWIIGTSIGAINAALITGNKPEDRLPKLKEFWKRVERANFWGAFPAWAGAGDVLASWMTLTKGISGFFEPHTRAFLGAHIPLGADHAGYYSTEPLRKTLKELVDFSLLNQCRRPPAQARSRIKVPPMVSERLTWAPLACAGKWQAGQRRAAIRRCRRRMPPSQTCRRSAQVPHCPPARQRNSLRDRARSPTHGRTAPHDRRTP